MPIVLADARQPDYPVVLANQAFLDLTGYRSEEVIGRNCRMLQGDATSPAAVAEIRFALAESREVNVELLNYRKDGSAFWNQLHLSPILDDDGVLAYYFASQIDVTAYRKVQTLEASEHRLLMEVDHRTKNALAIVDSIVRLTKADNMASYAASIQQRVQSLAQAHMILAKSSWQAIALVDVIQAQLAPYRSGKIRIGGPEVLIAAETVQPLSLVIHELAVNAVTHGSLSSAETGSLAITWSAGEQYGGFALRWRETGATLPAPNYPRGFGTIMWMPWLRSSSAARSCETGPMKV